MKRGRELLYPERKRCMICRRFFGFTVLAGLWCSYECAGHPAPSDRPQDWPREHFRRNGWGRRAVKKVFDSRDEAQNYQGHRSKSAYLCGYCLTWHVGTTRSGDLSRVPPGEEKQA